MKREGAEYGWQREKAEVGRDRRFSWGIKSLASPAERIRHFLFSKSALNLAASASSPQESTSGTPSESVSQRSLWISMWFGLGACSLSWFPVDNDPDVETFEE